MTAASKLDDARSRATRSRAITSSADVTPRRWLLLLHLALLTAMLVLASKAAGSSGAPAGTTAFTVGRAMILAGETPSRSAESESSTKPRTDATERTPGAAPSAAPKRGPARPARKDRVLPNPPEYPPLGRELALR
jgi:hypothetical protein